jgi:hypothetical protein
MITEFAISGYRRHWAPHELVGQAILSPADRPRSSVFIRG